MDDPLATCMPPLDLKPASVSVTIDTRGQASSPFNLLALVTVTPDKQYTCMHAECKVNEASDPRDRPDTCREGTLQTSVLLLQLASYIYLIF